MKHKHTFSKALADILMSVARTYRIGTPFHLQKDLRLTKNQYNNFQKLQYWGLVKKHYREGERVGGTWELTQDTEAVLKGYRIPKWVMTFNNRVIEKAYDLTIFSDVTGSYKLPEDYAKKAEPVVFAHELVGTQAQQSFFG
jgi:hypothetical protein